MTRAHGTGTVHQSGKLWYARLPGNPPAGEHPEELRGGFETREAASAALDAYLEGRPPEETQRKRGRKPGTETPEQARARKIAHGIGQYLAQLESGALNGSGSVYLGQLRNFPMQTTDPDVIDRAVAALEGRFRDTSQPLKRLKQRQRIMDLQAAAASLRARQSSPWRAHFVEHAAKWAAEEGISYAAFRDAGVPAETLREAGIEP